MNRIALICCLFLASSLSAQREVKNRAPHYWPRASAAYVEIDGYGFDFEKPCRGRGVVDGPWTHNGRYRIDRNGPGLLKMHVHFGTDGRQRSDMDVVVRIERGRARVTGSVSGRDIGKVTIPLRRIGDRLVLAFATRDASGARKKHEIRWKT